MTESAVRQRRRIARALSRAADASVAEALQIVPMVSAGVCRRIGVTGPPGAGKSSLIAVLAGERLAHNSDLAILAIDPTSPLGGGAMLGDRIRMEELALDPRVYIRSLASRRSADGLADNLPDMLEIIESAGFTELILETVGVGQAEHAVRHVVDTVLVVLMPGAGDQIQAMKSGVLETADILVVNKADQPGARQVAAELASVIKTRRRPNGVWVPSIVLTAATDPTSIGALSAEIDRHHAWLAMAGSDGVRRARRAHHLSSLVARRVNEVLEDLPDDILQKPLASIYETLIGRLSNR